MKCPTCGFDSLPGMSFCGMCGTRLAIACPACAFQNPPDYRFCGACGQSLDAEADAGVQTTGRESKRAEAVGAPIQPVTETPVSPAGMVSVGISAEPFRMNESHSAIPVRRNKGIFSSNNCKKENAVVRKSE